MCVCDHTACVRSCLSHTTARPAAQPPAQSERGRERKFTAKEQQQQQRAPERGRAASRRARRSGDQAQTRPAETAATTPTTPGASRPITSSTKNGTGLSSRPSFTGVETEPSTHRWGGQIDNAKPDTRSQMGCRQRKEGAVRTTYCAWRQYPSDLSLHRTPSRMYCRARRCR